MGKCFIVKIKYWIGSVVLSCNRPVATRFATCSLLTWSTHCRLFHWMNCVFYIFLTNTGCQSIKPNICRTETYSCTGGSKWRNKKLIATCKVSHKAQRPSPIFYIQMFIGESIIEGKNFSQTCQRVGPYMLEDTMAFFSSFIWRISPSRYNQLSSCYRSFRVHL